MAYIARARRLWAELANTPSPSSDELDRAVFNLRRSPVEGFPSFARLEVTLIARYRLQFTRHDDVWRSVVDGRPETWIFAIHEAAELDSFARSRVNPFDRTQFLSGFRTAHFTAIRVELDFLAGWPDQLGVRTSRFAIEWTNPIRGQYTANHRRTLDDIAGQNGWAEPNDSELACARQLWAIILDTGG